MEELTRSGEPDRRKKYPWDEWLNPDCTVRLVQGVDFDGRAGTIQGNAIGVAKTRGGKAVTRRGLDDQGRAYVEIDYYPPEKPEDPEEDIPEETFQVLTATRSSAKIAVDGSRVLIQVTKGRHVTHLSINNDLFVLLRKAMTEAGKPKAS